MSLTWGQNWPFRCWDRSSRTIDQKLWWNGMVISGQRSSKSTSVLIRNDKKDIQRQDGQKKQEKNWLTKHETYILVRVMHEQVCSLSSCLCFLVFVLSYFSRSALHRLSFSATHCSSRSLSWPCPAAFPTFADSLQVLQKKVDICLAPFN